MTRLPAFGTAAALLLLAGCTSLSPPAAAPAAGPVPPAVHPDAVVEEAWISAQIPGAGLGALAVWPTEDGGAWLIATARAADQLVVFDADTGQTLRTVGGPGEQPGQFRHPSGIAVWADLAFVVERDNHRVQVLELPDLRPRGFIGADTLKAPSGLWLQETAPDELELLVTDGFMADAQTGVLPPRAQMDRRVRRFKVALDQDGSITATDTGSFGDTGQGGMLRMVGSIAGDPAHDRLLIAEQDQQVGSTLRDYTLAGHLRGDSLPVFSATAKGVALWDCDMDSGWWIAVEPLTPTLFRVYDRASLAPAGTFAGARVSQTDGIVVYAAGTPRFPAGALFAQHEDRAVAAFDLRDVARALQLHGRCLP